MKKVLTWSLIIVALLSFFNLAWSQDFVSKTLLQGKVSIEIPASWSVEEEIEDGMVFITPGTDEKVAILIFVLESGVNLEEEKNAAIEIFKETMKIKSQLQLLEKGRFFLKGNIETLKEAYSFLTEKEVKGILTIYYGKIQDNAFILTTAVEEAIYPKYKEVLEKIIRSVGFPVVAVPQPRPAPTLQPGPAPTPQPGPAPALLQGWTSYTDPYGYFSIGIPPGWYFNPTPNPNIPAGVPYVNYAYVEGSRITADFSIIVETIPAGISLQAYAAAVEMNSLAKFPGYKKYSETSANIKGKQFVKRVFTANVTLPTGEQIPLYAEQYYYVSKNLAYTINLEAMLNDYQRFLGMFNSIVETFQPLK